jgi:hypothetical protein
MWDEGGQKSYLSTHVDDRLCFGPRRTARSTAQDILKVFLGSDLGEARFALGLLIERDWAARTVSISQEKLIGEVLERFNLAEAAPSKCPLVPGPPLITDTTLPPLTEAESSLYRSIVGTIMYLGTMTRPDVSFASTQLARFMASPTNEHLHAAIRTFCYMKGSMHLRLHFGSFQP